MIKNLFLKYKKLSIESKATVWYTISNIVQKIAPWLIMILLTRELSTKEYGIYAVFMSWMEIVEIIVTLRMYSSGYIVGLVQNDFDIEKYRVAIKKLLIILISFWLIIFIIFNKFICSLLDLDKFLVFFMFFSFYSSSLFGMWSSEQRVNNNFKLLFIFTLLYGIFGPIIGALTVFFKFDNPLLLVIGVRVIIQFIVSIPLFINIFKSKYIKCFDIMYIKGALKYNIPLLPYYLSMVILNTSDRLMIKNLVGYETAAIYNVAYSVSMTIFVISGALNLSLQPWLFKKIKNKELNFDDSKKVTIGTVVVAICCLLVLVIAPELILIMGGVKYLQAIYVMPPIIISILVMFIYQQFVNILFYYKKTNLILIASVLSAIFNIVLNYVFISKYGYYAAGYTTLASYCFVMFFYYFFMKKICKENSIVIGNIFNVKKQFLILFALIFIAIFVFLMYRLYILRYIFTLVILVFLFLKRNVIIEIIKKVKL